MGFLFAPTENYVLHFTLQCDNDLYGNTDSAAITN